MFLFVSFYHQLVAAECCDCFCSGILSAWLCYNQASDPGLPNLRVTGSDCLVRPMRVNDMQSQCHHHHHVTQSSHSINAINDMQSQCERFAVSTASYNQASDPQLPNPSLSDNVTAKLT
jgi:hypothetical protein